MAGFRCDELFGSTMPGKGVKGTSALAHETWLSWCCHSVSLRAMNKSERVSLGVGAGIGVFGFFLFALAHSFTAPPLGVSYETDARKAQEQTWQHYGTVLTIGGLIITAVALHSWMRRSSDHRSA